MKTLLLIPIMVALLLFPDGRFVPRWLRCHLVDGTDVDLDRFRERIGLVTQDTQLFSGSIRENLLLAMDFAGKIAKRDREQRAAALVVALAELALAFKE